jgi:hypothetical protein
MDRSVRFTDELQHPRLQMKVRLIRKLADVIDGVDLSGHAIGETLDVPAAEAALLIAERWAEPCWPDEGDGHPRRRRHSPSNRPGPAEAARSPRTLLTLERLRQMRRQMEQRRLGEEERRRAEDRIREELRESREKTISARRDPSAGE